MARVMMVQPWNYHDEGVKKYDLAHEWRNGPYSLLLLATILRQNNHEAIVVDMGRDLIAFKGDVSACLSKLSRTIKQFKPDIIGFSFFRYTISKPKELLMLPVRRVLLQE